MSVQTGSRPGLDSPGLFTPGWWKADAPVVTPAVDLKITLQAMPFAALTLRVMEFKPWL